jgi:hypothetical protein
MQWNDTSICSRIRFGMLMSKNFALKGRIQRRKREKENTATSSYYSHSPCKSWTLVLRRSEYLMPRDAATCAVLTVTIDHLLALPAELSPTLGAFHVTTSSVLLNVLRAIRAPLGLFLNGGQTFVLFLKSIFGAELVLLAGFVLVPRAIAGDASFGATVLAGADIWCAWTQDEGWSCGRCRGLLCVNCGADAPSDPAGPGGTLGFTQLDQIFFRAWKFLVTCTAFVNLPRHASWGETPAPPRDILCDVPALELDVPRTFCQWLVKMFCRIP